MIRATREHGGFDVLAQSVVRDTRISYRALGILMRLLSNAPGFSMDSNALAAARGKEGRDAVRTGLRELRQSGYITTAQSQLPNGHWVTQNTVHDLPADGSDPVAEPRVYVTRPVTRAVPAAPSPAPEPVKAQTAAADQAPAPAANVEVPLANVASATGPAPVPAAPQPVPTEDGFSVTEDGFSGVGETEDGFSGPGATEDGFSGAKSSKSTHKSKSIKAYAAQLAVLPVQPVPIPVLIRAKPATVASAPVTLDLPGIPSTPAPTAPIPEGPVAADTPAGRRRGCRIGNWRPDEGDIGWARAKFPAVDAAFEADQFVDYWKAKPGAAGCKLDWHLTWHSWIRNAVKYGQRQRQERKSKTERGVDAMHELAALYRKVCAREQTEAEYARYMELTNGRGV
ncbi:MAG TPA: hypothetical protein VFQ88_14100 [Nevskiaceae bacterium]|nr:hypothetical protein [Nevskiaceae bacterium]